MIEVLVSMMVMAITLTVIMNLFSGGLRSKKRAEEYIKAVDLADSKIQDVLSMDVIEPGVQEGEFDNGYSWKLEIIEQVPEERKGFKSTIKIQQIRKTYLITLDIKWKQGEKEKIYTIKTLQVL